MSPARPRCLIVLTVATLAVGLLTVAVPPAAATPTGSTSITAFLKAPDLTALDQLAATQGLTRAQRISAVSRLVPSAATHDQVGKALRAEGFSISAETSWSVTATGAAARAAALFGSRPSLGTHPNASRRSAATGALPRIPAQLSDAVAAVYPTRDGPPTFHHATTGDLAGPDFRNADTPAHVAPSTGTHDAGVTVATVQFADFFGSPSDPHKSDKAADLVSYAHEHGLTDPVANGQYKAVKVDGGPRSGDDTTGGDIEVNLDQQSILSTAPTANQHAYFGPNTEAGFNDAFAHVFDDVVGNSHATAPDPHIVALSSSWGQCESETGADSIATLEPILKSLVAAGVTVFASSGDDGIYDCGSLDGTGFDNHQADVDYPASSPSVVGVGGSNLSAANSVPNTGTNWTEKAWRCASPEACQGDAGTGGGGGGASGSAFAVSDFPGFAAPTYQRAAIANAPFKGNAKRLVPDITADGDPQTGFSVYTSNPQDMDPEGGNDVTIGGTSLSSPISAAQLVNTLADAGHKFGVGSIHGALYSAYAGTRSLPRSSAKRAFRDVTSGTNGAPKHRGSDPSVSAQTGYDTVSGLGGVLWQTLLPYLFDKHHPTAKATLRQTKLHTKSWRSVTAAWQVSRGADPNLLGTTDVRIARRGATALSYHAATLPASSSHTFKGSPGATYVLTATGRDLNRHASAPATATVQVPIDDSWYTVTKGWHRVAGSADIGGSHLRAAKKSAAARVSHYGRTYTLLVDTGPHSGKLGVYFRGKLVKTLNLHTSTYGRTAKTIYTSSTRAFRRFTFAALSARSVNVDGLYIT